MCPRTTHSKQGSGVPVFHTGRPSLPEGVTPAPAVWLIREAAPFKLRGCDFLTGHLGSATHPTHSDGPARQAGSSKPLRSHGTGSLKRRSHQTQGGGRGLQQGTEPMCAVGRGFRTSPTAFVHESPRAEKWCLGNVAPLSARLAHLSGAAGGQRPNRSVPKTSSQGRDRPLLA